jgi:hypothetical protein
MGTNRLLCSKITSPYQFIKRAFCIVNERSKAVAISMNLTIIYEQALIKLGAKLNNFFVMFSLGQREGTLLRKFASLVMPEFLFFMSG